MFVFSALASSVAPGILILSVVFIGHRVSLSLPLVVLSGTVGAPARAAINAILARRRAPPAARSGVPACVCARRDPVCGPRAVVARRRGRRSAGATLSRLAADGPFVLLLSSTLLGLFVYAAFEVVLPVGAVSSFHCADGAGYRTPASPQPARRTGKPGCASHAPGRRARGSLVGRERTSTNPIPSARERSMVG
jgi:hypothetical protein